MSNTPEFRYFDGRLDGIEPNGNREIVIPTPPAGVTGISSSAFYKCQDVESIVIPEGITEFRIWRPDEYGRSLKKMVLPSTLKTIEKGAFEGLDVLETVVLGEGTEIIEKDAFKNCTALKNIRFPSTIKMIGKSAFECCASLESVTLPVGIERVDTEAFKNCPRLTFSFEEGVSEKKKTALSALLPDQYTIYELCPEGVENKEGIEKITLNGHWPYHDKEIEIRTAILSREKYLELFDQTRPYYIIYGFCNDRETALCRSVRPNEAVYRDGKFYGIRAIYHDEGEYCDRTWAVLREPSDTPFILEIGKDAQTHVSCFCELTERPDSQSE